MTVANGVSSDDSSSAKGNFAVVLAEYDPTWPVAFHRESIRLLEATGGPLVGIEHIGSTSLPGLAAKPIIDMLAEVDEVELDSAPLVPLLEPLGYMDRSAEFTDRLLFSGGGAAMSHNLHIVARGTTSLRNEILVRDRMRRDPDAASRYQVLKYSLAARSYGDPHGYSRAKSDFVVTIIDQERAGRGMPPVNIWATLGPMRRNGRRSGWIRACSTGRGALGSPASQLSAPPGHP